MRVLVGCEKSQVVCKAFRVKGHEAYSCDIQQESGGYPEWHWRMDIVDAIKTKGPFDLIILHPDCTKLALSGNRWYGKGTPRHNERLSAIDLTVYFWNLAKECAERVVLENPMSVIFKHLKDADIQYIHPWQFGHGEKKKTGLALHNIKRLTPTKIVTGREERIWKMPPSPDRKEKRSITYKGIAEAMADQWGNSQPPDRG